MKQFPSSYFVAFRLNGFNDRYYQERRDRLLETVHQLSKGILWKDLPSFVLFHSDFDLETVASRIRQSVNEHVDIVLVGEVGCQSVKVSGSVKDNMVFSLLTSDY